MKGFIQGFLFILIIILIIAFLQFIGYIDRTVIGNEYNYSAGDDSEIEYWNEDIETSDGIRSGEERSIDNPIYEQRKKDFGSKSLNEKDKEKAAQEKKDKKSKSFDYLKK